MGSKLVVSNSYSIFVSRKKKRRCLPGGGEGLSHSASLRSIVIVLKVVAVKTNWWGGKYEFKHTSLLPNQKYEFKLLLV